MLGQEGYEKADKRPDDEAVARTLAGLGLRPLLNPSQLAPKMIEAVSSTSCESDDIETTLHPDTDQIYGMGI